MPCIPSPQFVRWYARLRPLKKLSEKHSDIRTVSGAIQTTVRECIDDETGISNTPPRFFAITWFTLICENSLKAVRKIADAPKACNRSDWISGVNTLMAVIILPQNSHRSDNAAKANTIPVYISVPAAQITYEVYRYPYEKRVIAGDKQSPWQQRGDADCKSRGSVQSPLEERQQTIAESDYGHEPQMPQPGILPVKVLRRRYCPTICFMEIHCGSNSNKSATAAVTVTK